MLNLLPSGGLQFRAAMQFIFSVTNSSGSPVEEVGTSVGGGREMSQKIPPKSGHLNHILKSE